MKQNSRSSVIILLLRGMMQQNTLKRFEFEGNTSANHGEFSFIVVRIEEVNKNSACKIAHVERNFPRLITRTIERNQERIIRRFLIKYIASVANNAGISHNISVRRHRQKFARLQNKIFISCGNVFFVNFAKFKISVVPIIGTAIRRIFETLHSDFVAVINARNARISHLPQRRHF